MQSPLPPRSLSACLVSLSPHFASTQKCPSMFFHSYSLFFFASRIEICNSYRILGMYQ